LIFYWLVVSSFAECRPFAVRQLVSYSFGKFRVALQKNAQMAWWRRGFSGSALASRAGFGAPPKRL